jgi:prepilin-type processing-associated H-X9-DG protein
MRDARRNHRASSGAFTLVELLVVIGIIGALIAILLPVLSGVQSRGRDIKCKSNLRQMMQAVIGYATENKGSVPYGFYYNRSNTDTNWGEAGDNAGSSGDPENEHPFISWPSQLGKWMGKRLGGDNDDTNFPPVLRCPEAEQSYPHVVSYIGNMIIFVNPSDELQVGTRPNAQVKPALLTQLTKETACIWDTAVFPGSENNVGFLTSGDLDGQGFWAGAATPEKRYLFANDPLGQFPPPGPANLGQGGLVKLNLTGQPAFKNIDPGVNPADAPVFNYQGNLRFRHNKETQCNVGFADGHVEAFTCHMERDKTVKNLNHDAIRRKFMIKPPSSVTATF